MRWPSIRRPLDWLYILSCLVFTGFVLVPEIFRPNGKTKDYGLWYWAGQQVMNGGPLYESRQQAGLLDFIYPPLSAILLALPSALGKLPFYFGLCLLNAAAWWMSAQLSHALSGDSRAPTPWVEALPSFAVLIFVFDQFDVGQPNLVLLAMMLLGFWLMQRNRPVIAGGLFALATAIKVFPVAVLPYLVWRRRWAAVSGMLVGLVLFLLVLPASIRGFDRNLSELSTWRHEMIGTTSETGFGQRPDQNWSWVNQSLIAVGHRLLRPLDYIRDENKPARYVNVADLGYAGANLGVLLLAGAIGLWFVAIMRPRAQLTPRYEADEIGILFCLMTVASPLAREYYFVWLLFPLTVLAHRAVDDPRSLVRSCTWIVMVVALALMVLTIPGFSRVWSALGNISFATLLLAATLGWHLRHPPGDAKAEGLAEPLIAHRI